MSESHIANVRRRDTQKEAAAITPGGRGYGFVPSDDSKDSKPVTVIDRADAIWFEDHDGYVVEWLDQEPPPA